MNRTPATRRLSSPLSSIYRQVFPRLLLVLGGTAAGLAVWSTMTRDDPEWSFGFLVFLLFLVVVVGVGYAITSTIASGLADEVFDGGDHLRVRIRNAVDSVHRSDV